MLRPIKLRYYVSYMVEHGYSASAVLAGTGISAEQLYDTALLIDPYQYEVAIRNMLRITKDPALGFKVGANLELNDMGIVAYAMMSSKTLREAALLTNQYQNLVGMTVQMAIAEEKTKWTVVLKPTGIREQTVRFYTEEVLSSVLKIGEALTGKHYVPHAANIAFPPPPHADSYAELLRCPVRFNAPHTSLTVRTPLLDMPLRGNDPEFHEICLRQCGQIMQDINKSSQIIARLRGFFLSQPTQPPTLEAAALHLGLSARTLRRHLEKEGTSYQTLTNNFRLDLAKEYLKSGHMTPKEIGYLVGFKDISAFRRAFKAWTGKTVQQFRKENYG